MSPPNGHPMCDWLVDEIINRLLKSSTSLSARFGSDDKLLDRGGALVDIASIREVIDELERRALSG